MILKLQKSYLFSAGTQFLSIWGSRHTPTYTRTHTPISVPRPLFPQLPGLRNPLVCLASHSPLFPISISLFWNVFYFPIWLFPLSLFVFSPELL